MNQLLNHLILLACCAVVTTASGVLFLWTASAEAQGAGFVKSMNEEQIAPVRKGLKLKWAQAPSRDMKKRKREKELVLPKTYVKVTLGLIPVLSKEKVEDIDQARSKSSKSTLVRGQPRRDRKIKIQRTVFKPWFRYFVDSLRLGGYVVEDYIKPLHGNDIDEEINQLGVNLKISGQTYLWRPWFAVVGGGIGVSAGKTDSISNKSNYNALVGDVRLSIFPASRFPFEVKYERNKSQIDYNQYGSVADTEKYRIHQRYKSPGGASYFLTYEMSTIKSETEDPVGGVQIGRPLNDEVQTLIVGSSKSFKDHNLNLNGQYTSIDRLDSVVSSQNTSIVGTHRYFPGGSLSVDNMVSFYKDVDVSLLGGDVTETDKFNRLERDVFQVTNFSFWRPEDKPLSLNIGARYFATAFSRYSQIDGVSLGRTEFENTNANINLGLNYDVDQNLRLRSAGNFTRTTSGNVEALSSDQSLGLIYSSDDIKISTAVYSWQYSNTLYNTLGDKENLLFMRTQLGHSLKKVVKVGEISNFSIDLSQIYSILHYIKASHDAYNTPSSPTEERLTHAVSLGWNSSAYWGRVAVRLTGTDMRNRGVAFREEEQVFQIVTFTTIIETMISRYQRLLMDINVQYTNDNSTDDYRFTDYTRARGSISYRNGKFFGVRNLKFTSEMRVTDQSLIPSFGNEDEYESFSWENKLDLRVGRLEMTGLVRMAEINRAIRHVAMLRVLRSFGR